MATSKKKDFSKVNTDPLYNQNIEEATAETSQDKEGTYQFNMRVPLSYKQPLDDVKWETRQTVSEYIRGLIEADLKRRGKI